MLGKTIHIPYHPPVIIVDDIPARDSLVGIIPGRLVFVKATEQLFIWKGTTYGEITIT